MATLDMEIDIEISEVGPRDGLQSISPIMRTDDKKNWITALAAAGLPEIEVGSFVPAKVLPQLADTAELVKHARSIAGLKVAVLVPNVRGSNGYGKTYLSLDNGAAREESVKDIGAFLDWIAANPGWSSLIIFVISFAESVALLGLLIPGIFLLFGFGTLIGLQTLDFWSVWFWSSAGAVLGDTLSFMLGARYQQSLLNLWPFRSYPNSLRVGQDFIHKHGKKSIFLGRFIGPLRPVVPVCAGILGMKKKAFLGIAIPVCIAWSPAYLLPGMLFGASLEVASEYAGRLSIFVMVYYSRYLKKARSFLLSGDFMYSSAFCLLKGLVMKIAIGEILPSTHSSGSTL